ncbi:DeoR family transcriptional regulator [Alteribacter keqinensis]|uniref:DeoR family transcriptional regulator n=1 Tax=Alteribacter keqinensis TaxID=2483800 RepID=A0A3M7TZE7_9BACI|nr:DeoR family transcriptional regulator [Alteribacter keqinensis]
MHTYLQPACKWQESTFIRSGSLKASTDRMLTRIKSMYLYIKKRGNVTTLELVEEFGTTHRTIQRDLNVLEYNNLVESPSRGTWVVTERKTKVS